MPEMVVPALSIRDSTTGLWCMERSEITYTAQLWAIFWGAHDVLDRCPPKGLWEVPYFHLEPKIRKLS